ncbi:ribonuclease HI family protein [candidate division KSB1 bacterium]|nr:ribonuclease HI family protein [candidate division KSB1 bacterium]
MDQYLHGKAENPSKKVIIHIDGAARNNPGPAGIGIVILNAEGNTLREHHEYIGEETNNIAEYRALLKALHLAGEMDLDDLVVRTDSELLAKQMNGTYRVKNINLLNLYFQVQEKKASFARLVIEQVPRQDNRRADMLANLAIDAAQMA